MALRQRRLYRLSVGFVLAWTTSASCQPPPAMGTIEGRAAWPNGVTPAEHHRVRLTPVEGGTSEQEKRVAYVDRHGLFGFARVPEGQYRLQLLRKKEVVIDREIVVTPLRTTKLTLELPGIYVRKLLGGDVLVAGVVHDEAGAPVNRATVRYGDSASTQTDERGYFAFRLGKNWAPNELHYYVWHPGYLPTQRWIEVRQDLPAEHITLRTGGVVTGTACDSDGNPIESARVCVMHRQAFVGSRWWCRRLWAPRTPSRPYTASYTCHTTAAEDDTHPPGSYRITGLPTDDYAAVLTHPGYPPTVSALTRVSGEGPPVTIDLCPDTRGWVRVTGQVLGIDGAPAARTSVRIHEHRHGYWEFVAAQFLDSEGRYVLWARTDNRYELRVKATHADDCWYAVADTKGVTSPEQDLDFTLGPGPDIGSSQRPEGYIIGRHPPMDACPEFFVRWPDADELRRLLGQVFLPDGTTPAPDATVRSVDTISPGTPIIADEQGRFRAYYVPQQATRLGVHHPGAAPTIARVPAGVGELKVVLRSGGTLRGHVCRGDSDEPAAHVRVVALRKGTGLTIAHVDFLLVRYWASHASLAAGAIVPTVTDADGAYRLDHVAAGTYEVVVTEDHQVCATHAGVQVTDGGDAAVDFVLPDTAP